MKISDVVFTNHSIDRLKERGITGEMVYQTVKAPEISTPGKEKHTTEFVKRFGDRKLTCIGKKNDLGEWVVLSAWIDPPFEGTKDFTKHLKYKKGLEKAKEFRKKMEKASFWGKMWLAFKKQAGF